MVCLSKWNFKVNFKLHYDYTLCLILQKNRGVDPASHVSLLGSYVARISGTIDKLSIFSIMSLLIKGWGAAPVFSFFYFGCGRLNESKIV